MNKICDSTFRNCISLKRILISELLIDEIGQHAFSGCSSLIQFSIPQTVEKIGCFAFKGCSFLTEAEIPFKITVIEPYTFADCSSIVKVKITDSLKIIKDYAFNGCSSLTDISIPSSVKLIGDSAFGGCSSLKKLSISPSVKINKERAFRKCTSLESIKKEKCSLPLLVNEKLFEKGDHLSHSYNRWHINDVHIVEDKRTGKSYVEKTIFHNDDNDDNERDNSFMYHKIENILRLYMNANHPTFINFLGYSFEKKENNSEKLTIIMEKAANNSLQNLFKDVERSIAPRQYNNTIQQIILIGIARGMKYLLDNCNLNFFLLPKKILLDDNFYPRINISDNIIKEMDQHFDDSDIIYFPPELLVDFEVNEKSFVYSFAFIMYTIVTGRTPYAYELRHFRRFQFLHKVLECEMRPQFEYPIKSEIKELIKYCWSQNPDRRPTFKEIFEKLAYDTEYYLEDVDLDEVEHYINLITSK